MDILRNEYFTSHGIFMYFDKDFYTTIYRKSRKFKKVSWNTCTPYVEDIKITNEMEVPEKFLKLLARKAKKWKKSWIEFTISKHNGNTAIAIVSPKDHFSRKIGFEASVGRLERSLRIGRFSNKPYPKIPEFIAV